MKCVILVIKKSRDSQKRFFFQSTKLTKMVEKAVVNASILTVTLAFLGFSILTLASNYENTSFAEQVSFLDRLTRFSDFFQMAYQRLFESMGKGFEKLDKRTERFERLSIDGRREELVSPHFQLAFVLLLFVCGLLSSPDSRVMKEMRKNKTGGNVKKSKWRRKNRKKMKKRRIALKTGKKRY